MSDDTWKIALAVLGFVGPLAGVIVGAYFSKVIADGAAKNQRELALEADNRKAMREVGDEQRKLKRESLLSLLELQRDAHAEYQRLIAKWSVPPVYKMYMPRELEEASDENRAESMGMIPRLSIAFGNQEFAALAGLALRDLHWTEATDENQAIRHGALKRCTDARFEMERCLAETLKEAEYRLPTIAAIPETLRAAKKAD